MCDRFGAADCVNLTGIITCHSASHRREDGGRNCRSSAEWGQRHKEHAIGKVVKVGAPKLDGQGVLCRFHHANQRYQTDIGRLCQRNKFAQLGVAPNT
jgi:hypothetical protein